jgi:YD repeat-containing protein
MANILHVTVANKVATYNRRDGEIVCGNKDYTIQFTFDEEWAGQGVKTARFISAQGYEDVVFEGNEVAVPVIINSFSVQVGVFAGDLQTTTPATIPCRKSILCQGGAPADPTPDVYAQIMALLNQGVTRIDMSAFATEGRIVEELADGTTRTTVMEFDEAGNPVKITDPDGNETVLVW